MHIIWLAFIFSLLTLFSLSVIVRPTFFKIKFSTLLSSF